MEDSQGTYSPDYKAINIKTVDGSVVRGKTNIAPYKRLSDMLMQQTGKFLVITEASFKGTGGHTVFVNKEHIVWVEPAD